jgi:hypothetical protein
MQFKTALTPMLRRLLNIASVVCLVACVALMGMWVSTNYRCVEVKGHLPFRQIFDVFTMPGRVYVSWITWQTPAVKKVGVIDSIGEFLATAIAAKPLSKSTERTASDVSPWSITWQPYDWFSMGRDPSKPPGLLELLGFAAGHDNIYGWVVVAPFWLLVLASGSLAMAFRLRWPWQFSLRSVFIATTFLAVVLGMITWLDRAWIGRRGEPVLRSIFGIVVCCPMRSGSCWNG